ncbi:MAG: phosphoribosyltransferase family protein [Patescibacteria group bacterium]|nr:phosphoribosyltransferase family protein [Patescibacteria group bacterium]
MPKTFLDLNILNIIKKLYTISTEIIFPYYCYRCLSFLNEQSYLCQNCLKEINFGLKIFCPKCQRRKPISEKITEVCCANIIKTLITFSDYEQPLIAKLIKEGKFNSYKEIFIWLGRLISTEIKIINLKNFYLTYVPTTVKIEKERGFNQAKILAQEISRILNLPIFEKIKKIRETEFQSHLNYQQRKENIQNCFQVISSPPKNLIIVDDIITTGTTLFELAQKLKESGCKNIMALTICR